MRALNVWIDEFAAALESLSGNRPDVRGAGSAPAVPRPAMVWWRLSGGPGAGTVWIGAESTARRTLGKMVLSAAGIADPTSAEADEAYLELIGRSWHGMRESGWSGGASGEPPAGVVLETIEIQLPGAGGIRLLSAHVPAREVETPAGPDSISDLLLDVELPVAVRFASTRMVLEDVAALAAGSLVEFNRAVDEPVEMLVNSRLVARGEIVVVNGNYAVRVSEVCSEAPRNV